MNVTEELDQERQRIHQDLEAARGRLADLTERRRGAQERLATFRAERDAVVAVADPDAKTATTRRRALLDAELELEEFAGALGGAQARVTELEAAQDLVGRKLRALTAKTELETHLRLAAELDAAWQPMLARLHEFVESARDVAALAGPVVDRGTVSNLPGERLVAIMLWRLREAVGGLDATQLHWALVDSHQHVTFHQSEATRFQRERQAIDEILGT